MKCPKCGYVGFEVRDRCRHCGYDFSFVPLPGTDAPLATVDRVDTFGSPEDLFGPGVGGEPPSPERLGFVDVHEMGTSILEEMPAADAPLAPPPASPTATQAAALLRGDLLGHVPPPAPPPLAVRKTTDRPRPRTTTQVMRRSEPTPEAPLLVEGPAPAPDARPPLEPASLGQRLSAAVIDGLLLGAIDITILYLTIRLVGLSMNDVSVVPPIPFGAFLLGLNVAYLSAFTASGGQTLGKMATGVRAVSPEGPIPFGRAVVRVAAAIVGALCLGLGYLPVLFGTERRAVHDRLLDTRVVRAAA